MHPQDLATFLKDPRPPLFIKDYARFRRAVEFAVAKAKPSGLTFEWHPQIQVEIPAEVAALPTEIREVFANPYIYLGRYPDGRWDAVIVLDAQDHNHRVLGWLKDALGQPSLRVGQIDSHEPDMVLPGPIPGNDLMETWKTWSEHPIEVFWWALPETDAGQLLCLHPVHGIGSMLGGIEGEDEEEGEGVLYLKREFLAKAKVLAHDKQWVWVQVEGGLYRAETLDWSHWQNPARPDLKQSEGK